MNRTPYRWLFYSLLSILTLAGLFLVYVTITTPAQSERTEELFVYGTLTNPIIRIITCRCQVPLLPATLDDYRKEGLTIIPDPEAQVTGGIITITPKELARLDKYEDIPIQYRRERVTIDGRSVWVYIKNTAAASE